MRCTWIVDMLTSCRFMAKLIPKVECQDDESHTATQLLDLQAETFEPLNAVTDKLATTH